MEKLKTLHTDLESGILIITLNKPDKHNALTIQCMDELRTVIQRVYDKPEIKSALITGAGEEVFSVGADVHEIKELNELNGRKFAEEGQDTFALIESCHKPIIAAINGHALAGGCELALACHLRVASENASFGLPQVMRGSIPGFGGTQRLPQLLGKAKALEILLTGHSFSALEAKEMGLVNHLVSSPEDVVKKSQELLHKIMANAPLAVGAILNCTSAVYNTYENGYQTEANAFANCCKSEDLKIGITAFLEQKTPQFKGM
jgi:enoyl-CoA hydratase